MRIDLFNGFELADIIFDYISLKFTRMFRGSGTITLEINDLNLARNIRKNQIILLGEDAYIIENIHKYKNADKNIIVEITGKHINCILSRRVITSFTFTPDQTYVEQIETVINENFINPTDIKRKIEGFEFETSELVKYPTTSYTYSNMTVQELMNRACANASYGYKIMYLPEQQKLSLKLIEIRDLTDEVFFSEEYGNISEAEYYEQSDNYKNVCYSNVEGVVSIHGYGIGIDRREMIIEQEYSGELNDAKELVGVEFVAKETDQYKYKVDWDIGDKVSYLDKDLNIATERQILGVTEYHSNVKEIEVIFGDSIPTIFDKLKKG